MSDVILLTVTCTVNTMQLVVAEILLTLYALMVQGVQNCYKQVSNCQVAAD